jgi:hypothetical protein
LKNRRIGDTARALEGTDPEAGLGWRAGGEGEGKAPTFSRRSVDLGVTLTCATAGSTALRSDHY